DLRVRHQATRTENLAELADHTHGVRRGDAQIEIDGAAFHGSRQVVEADDVRTGSLGSLGLFALREDGNANALAGTCRQHHRTTHQLVGFTRIDTQVDRDVDGLVELGGRTTLHEVERLRNGIDAVTVDLGAQRLNAFGKLCHDQRPSTVMPMLRAEPAMVRTAASMSAAVRSFILVVAISSTWARVSEPTLSVSGRGEPFWILAAFLIRTAAGGVFMMKVKLLSAKAVMTTGIGRPGSMPCVCALNALQNSMM